MLCVCVVMCVCVMSVVVDSVVCPVCVCVWVVVDVCVCVCVLVVCVCGVCGCVCVCVCVRECFGIQHTQTAQSFYYYLNVCVLLCYSGCTCMKLRISISTCGEMFLKPHTRAFFHTHKLVHSLLIVLRASHV